MQWEAAGRTGPLIPPDYIAWLKSLHVNWIGLSVALHYDDSMDSTVERVTSSDVDVPTYPDATLRQLIREFRSHGINVYLTLAFEAAEAETAARPVYRHDLGDPGFPGTGVPYGTDIKPEFWPWRPRPPGPPTVCGRVLGDLYAAGGAFCPHRRGGRRPACTRSARRRNGSSARGPRAITGSMISDRNSNPWSPGSAPSTVGC